MLSIYCIKISITTDFGIGKKGRKIMENSSRIVSLGKENVLIGEKGERLTPPKGWAFQAAGDAGITRKITAKKVYWRVQIKKGRRTISKGVWAPADTIALAKQEVIATRSTDSYKKKMISDRKRREKKQTEYEKEFFQAVKHYLSFTPYFEELENKLAEAVTAHAIPVGSGTVARTAMIPLEERAAKAVIAWMRHQTTAYDSMQIPFIKGKRREVRRMLAERSSQLLKSYRKGDNIPVNCPLRKALEKENL